MPKRSNLHVSGNQSSRLLSKQRTIRTPLVFGLLLGSCVSATAEPIDPARVRVIDGHTIAVEGKPRNIRLVGFYAPGIRNAKCKAEARLGEKATNRLRELVKKRPLELTIVACACKPGTTGTRRCNGGRACGMLMSRGWDVGEILIGEGLAVPFKCGKTSCPKTPRPWCG